MWQLADYSASLSLPSFAAQVNVLEPWRGLLAPKWFNTDLPSLVSVLQVDARELIAPNRLPLDVYERGPDIVATYAPSEGRNVQTQIYWRATEPQCGGPAAGVELIISAQTHLLDSRPGLSTTSTLPAGSVFQLTDDAAQLEELSFDGTMKHDFSPAQRTTLFLFRPWGATFSYVEMIHPTDFAGASIELRGENLFRLTNHLFPERLEKGVIRRARVFGVFLSQVSDLRCAMAAYREFSDEPLPLTT